MNISQLDKEDQAGIVQDGLTSRQSYVVLSHNGRAGVHLGLRPSVYRVDKNTIWLGGRLRTAFDFDGEAHQTKKPKMAKLDDTQAVKKLHEEFPGFKWQTGDGMRCSTTVGILIAAGLGDSKKFQKLWDEVDYVGALLDGISEVVNQTLGGTTDVKQARNKCIASLTRKYEEVLWHAFGEPGKQTMLKKGVLGEISDLLNQGSERGFDAKQTDFCNKVEKEQAKNA